MHDKDLAMWTCQRMKNHRYISRDIFQFVDSLLIGAINFFKKPSLSRYEISTFHTNPTRFTFFCCEAIKSSSEGCCRKWRRQRQPPRRGGSGVPQNYRSLADLCQLFLPVEVVRTAINPATTHRPGPAAFNWHHSTIRRSRFLRATAARLNQARNKSIIPTRS